MKYTIALALLAASTSAIHLHKDAAKGPTQADYDATVEKDLTAAVQASQKASGAAIAALTADDTKIFKTIDEKLNKANTLVLKNGGKNQAFDDGKGQEEAFEKVKEIKADTWNLKENIDKEAKEIVNHFSQELKLSNPTIQTKEMQEAKMAHLRSVGKDWVTKQYELEAMFAKTGMREQWLMDHEWGGSREAQTEDIVIMLSNKIAEKIADKKHMDKFNKV